MKKIKLSIVLMLSLTVLIASAAFGATAGTVVNNALSAARDGFFRSIGEYFAVPQTQIVYVQQQRIPDDEIPVVFYMARQAKVTPATIIALRLKGDSWQVITNKYGYGPEIFYVPVNAKMAIGPPYGHAYGYYRNKPKKDWNKIKLEDADIINLVNLKFISEHYKYPVDSIMKMRQKNKVFYTIGDDIEKQKKANMKAAKPAPAKKAKAAPGQTKKPKAAKKAKVAPGQSKKNKDNPGQSKKPKAAPGQSNKQKDSQGQNKQKGNQGQGHKQGKNGK